MSSSGLFKALLAICVVLALVDVANLALHLFNNYGYFSAESLPNFYGFFALICILLFVPIAKGWRALVMREKDYYDNDVD